MFFGADRARIVNDALGALRLEIAALTGRVSEGWKPLWVVDFPMFESDPATGRWLPLHHPFTAPVESDPEALLASPGTAVSRGYDMVLNGAEIGGGSERIHSRDVQQAVFTLLNIDETEATEKFGFLLDALKFGCPPHGGIAFGVDRIVALMAGTANIREVIAFPKTQTAHCPLTDAPAPVTDAHLRELGLKLRARPTAGKDETQG